MIPVPVRVVVFCGLGLWGAWTVGDLAFTVALFTLAALWLLWAFAGAAPRGDE